MIKSPSGISIGALLISGILAWYWAAGTKKKKK